MQRIELGLLEFGAGQTDLKTLITNLFEYAVKAENLGFSKFWLGEHYLVNSLWYNPEILIPIIAGQTEKISIGIAGVLLAHHAPYDVAQKYKLLSNLFPGRIDLGIAKGNAPKEISSMLPGNSNNGDRIISIVEQTASLISMIRDDRLAENGVPLVPPYKGAVPNIWGLKSGFANLNEITELNINCSVSLFHTKREADSLNFEKERVIKFKEEYYRQNGYSPKINVAIAGICAKDSLVAKKALHSIQTKVGFEISNVLLGSSSYFFDTLSLYQEILGIDEFVILNMAKQQKPKFTCIELLAKEFALK